MILISHRGNIDGKEPSLENRPDFIDNAIRHGFDVEIDIRYIDGNLFLGHDKADYNIDFKWLNERIDKLWVHCKNHSAVDFFYSTDFNYFWHDSDDMTITSKGIIWAHPKIQPIKNSIAVLPDGNDWEIENCKGICSDYIKNYLNFK